MKKKLYFISLDGKKKGEFIKNLFFNPFYFWEKKIMFMHWQCKRKTFLFAQLDYKPFVECPEFLKMPFSHKETL